MEKRKLKMGIVGGGKTGFIGAIHIRAAIMENLVELVCGCFSSNPEVSKESGRSWYLPDNRIYGSYTEMFDKEMELPEGERMDFVAIVTPNHLHFQPAMMALERGIHVVLDKPMTFSLEEAKLLKKKVDETGLVLALTHVYTGYPAVKEIKSRITKGDLGKLRRVYVEYPQGWLSERIELQEGNNAGWRTNPSTSGKAGCMGDIGTHAWHLCEYVTGLKVTEICAELNSFVDGRELDDDGAALMRMENGVKTLLSASQIAVGEANGLNIRVYGEKGGFRWKQMDPNILFFMQSGKPEEIIHIGNNSNLSPEALWNVRTPAGHPEGFMEAFANIYRNFSLTVLAGMFGEKPSAEMLDFPDVNDGVRGMQFIETVVKSGWSDSDKWTPWVD
ncbi:MAG: Gfo/Idh/MocA family oxidoreductase [Fermentimonas sp.]|nr:Gfo/Idh/MocA family oxidoreductase [Fermentimonas sp.]